MAQYLDFFFGPFSGGRMQKRFLNVSLAVLIFTALLFAQQQPAKKPPLSPRRQAEFTFSDGKKIVVDYGAPSIRGRKIMGELVPYGKVWRTGANEATSFVTEADLVIGGVMVPAGKYTLYTLPSQDAWKLIVNKQTGQWGTVYDQSQDLARIELKKSTLPQSVEQMTFSFDKLPGDKARLKLEWETTGLSVEVAEKR
jgi:Protein of unknown function (DUF2911)